MSKLDDLINESLSEEDEALLESHGREPGYFKQAMALFRGQLGWVMWFVGILQLIFFACAIYALVKVFTGEELMGVLRWGVVTIVLVQLSTFLRGFMGAHFEANRVLRGVARLELRMANNNRQD